MNYKYRSIAILALFLTILDLTAKWLAQKYLTAPLELWPGFLQLKLSYNPGIAFSIPVPNLAMIIATPFLLVALLYGIRHACNMRHTISKISVALIVAGGIGNFINRIWTGAVIDFLDFSFWPSFNLADAYLTIGAFLLIIFYGKIKLKNS
ncbi:signal peptidase II [Candidatus Peregrinibacteria bacterium]|nr:signal peptidase II [Candidatus Peregrinibacteria bacterium]